MKAMLSLVDNEGNSYHGTVELLPVTTASEKVPNPGPEPHPADIEFGLPVRAFARKYATRASSGAARFTVLLAFLARGSPNADIPAETIQAEWGKLTAHLGAFNRAHATRAKDRAWVDSHGQGMYRLGPRWHEAFS